MKERAIKLLSVLFITSSLLVALFPFCVLVYADNPTYTEVIANDCFLVVNRNNTSGFGSVKLSVTNNSRVVTIRSGSNIRIYAISNNINTLFDFKNTNINDSCYVPTNSQSYIYNNITYSGYNISVTSNDIQYITVPIMDIVSGLTFEQSAIYYTYGDGAVDPAPELNYGDLIIEGYSTDIAGSGSAAIQNIDHIRWNPDIDTNGNDISNLKVRVKIVPGNYVSSRASDLLLQKYDDFIEDKFNSDETVYDASDGEAIISWEYIVNRFDNFINRIYLFQMGLNANTWEKQGWLYKLRLEDNDNEYTGDWQTVYSSTSSGVKNDLNIVNNNSISQEFITTLQEINNINNVENNWTVKNTEISITNNYTEPSQGEKPWWAYLLESIFNTLNITNKYINEGNENTINITNTVDNSDDNMNLKINEYQQYEDDFIQDMDDNLLNIDTDVPLLSNNKFISSANWVAQQYTRMTNNTVIGSLLGFSLVFGLALIFIGRIK